MTHNEIVDSLVHSASLYLHGFDPSFEKPAKLTADQLKKSLIQYDYQHQEGLDPSYTSNAMGGKQRSTPRVHSTRIHLQGLHSGYSSNSMGDGPPWIPLTAELQEAIAQVAPTIDGCDITADRLAALSADMAAPYSLRVHWDGAKVCVTQMVLISYGYKCSECANLFIGNDETKETITVTCSECACITNAERLWLVKENHPTVANAIRMRETMSTTQSVRRHLDLSDMTPVKGSFLLNTDVCVTADTRLLFISKCSRCGELVQPNSYFTVKNCHKCNSVLELPVEYAIDADISYEPAALEKYSISKPTEIQLIMGGFRLPEEIRLIQSKGKYRTFFQSWPVTSPGEVKAATCSGEVQISNSGFTSQSLKHLITNFEAKHKMIGSGVTGGYTEMKYLSDISRTTRTERHRQQEAFLAYLKDVNCLSIFFAMTRGEFMIYSDKEENTPTLASMEIRNLALKLIDLSHKWPNFNYTFLHRQATELSRVYTSLVVIDARTLMIIDTFLCKALMKFLPTTFTARMKSQCKEFETDSISFPGMVALIFGDDRSDKSMYASVDRQECDKQLKVKFTKDMSVQNFQTSFKNALIEYDLCSSIHKFAKSRDGEAEQAEFILQLIEDGDLRKSVATKFDKLRAEARIDETELPGIDKFWELLTRIHGILENQRIRTMVSTGSNKRIKEETNTIRIDGGYDGKSSIACRKFKAGSCIHGSKCRFEHVSDNNKRVTFEKTGKNRSNGKGKGKDKLAIADKSPLKTPVGYGKGKGKGKNLGKGAHNASGKGNEQPDPDHTYCSRCCKYHRGLTDAKCVMSPCRYCTSKNLSNSAHHLKYCEQKPEGYEFRPHYEDSPKRPAAKDENPSPVKKARQSPQEWLEGANPKQFRNMLQTVNSLNVHMEAERLEEIDEESEEPQEIVTALAVRKATPRGTPVQAAETTHLVPYIARPNTASVIKSVIRIKPKTSEGELLRNALLKVKSNIGGRQSHMTLTEISTKDDTSSMWNGGTIQSMADDEEIENIELSFRTDLRTMESLQSGCSEDRATQKTSTKFLDFTDSNDRVPNVIGEVSTLSIGFTASPTESLLTAQYKIQQMLITVQEPDDDPNKSSDTIVHSMNQFPEFQHDEGIPLHPLYRAISNGEFGHQIHSVSPQGYDYQQSKTTLIDSGATCEIRIMTPRDHTTGNHKCVWNPSLESLDQSLFCFEYKLNSAGESEIQQTLTRYEHRRAAQIANLLSLVKAQQRLLFGKVHRADRAGQIWHRDISLSEDGLEIETNQYDDTLTNAMSGDMLVVPTVYGSHFGEVMRMSVATLSSPPESKTLDYGDLNQTESSMQELRDTSMTLLTLAAMSSKYWPWALQYAVDKYNFLPRKNGIAPQRHWKDKRPPDLSIPMFGSRIVFRQ